jgi:hypothetical protein
MNDEPPKNQQGHLVGLAGSIGGCCIAILAIGALWGGGNAWPFAAAALGLAAMGVAIAFLISKST